MMKRDFFRARTYLTGALFCALFAACAGNPAPLAAQSAGTEVPADASLPVLAQAAAPDDLDAALREASTYLNGRVPKASKTVFLNIKSDYPDLSEYILSVLSENAVNDGAFSVVDRQLLDSIRDELDFQMSGEVSDESAQSIGKMLGAQSIVSGTVSKIASLYRVQVKAIAVQTAGVQGQWSRNIAGSGTTIAALTEKFVPAQAANAPARRQTPAAPGQAGGAAQAAAQAQTPAASPGKAYKIGDTGPAGGIVFFDKWNDSGGWRYLEAAPADIDLKLFAGSENVSYTDCRNRAVGTGKSNTQTIAGKGGFGLAAQACEALAINGFNDWFLPSRDELNYMYDNLHLRGAGGFKKEPYWSSTCYESRNDYFYDKNFSNGNVDYNNGVSYQRCVRAIRQF